MGFFSRSKPRASSEELILSLTPAVIALSKQSAEALMAAMKESGVGPGDPYAGTQMLIDFLFFNYQWVDRVAFKSLGDKRIPFMDSFRESLMAELAQFALVPTLSAKERAQGIEELQRSLDRFLVEFGTYNATPETQGGALKGTLFWEFGKRVALDSGNPNHLLVIGLASVQALSAIGAMDIPKLLATLR